MIIVEVLESQEVCYVNSDVDRPALREYKAMRKRRLAWFRDLACVCKAWVDSARTSFWKEVILSNAEQLIDFARAINNPSANLHSKAILSVSE